MCRFEVHSLVAPCDLSPSGKVHIDSRISESYLQGFRGHLEAGIAPVRSFAQLDGLFCSIAVDT